jgi:hypothetical protein
MSAPNIRSRAAETARPIDLAGEQNGGYRAVRGMPGSDRLCDEASARARTPSASFRVSGL